MNGTEYEWNMQVNGLGRERGRQRGIKRERNQAKAHLSRFRSLHEVLFGAILEENRFD
jgi:hypothetical protein